MKLYRLFVVIVFCISSSVIAKAQQPAALNDTSAQKIINILHADRIGFLKTDTADYQILGGNVKVQQGKSLFYCDSASINTTRNVLESYGHVHINDADSVHIYSNYLKYRSQDKIANLSGNVKLTDGNGILTTPSLQYDLNTKIATYTEGGKIVDGKTTLTSKEAQYYEVTRDVYFRKNVVLTDPDYNVVTDTLLYNTVSNIATFVAPTTITSDSSRKKVITSDGYYDTKNKKVYFGKRSQIQDGSVFLTADDIINDDSTGFGEARGNVIYNDTQQHVMIIANNLKTNSKEKSFLATQKPVMILKQEEDSIFISADTMYSARLTYLRKFRSIPQVVDSLTKNDSTLSDDDSANRFFEAYYHVKIFSDSLQAVGDSMFYSSLDSVFRLFKNPVMWARSNQVTGDTIYLYTKNKKPQRMYVFENALAIDKVGSNYYNQVKGRTINGYFVNGDIDSMRAKGNAESIYYAQDEQNKFIGVNRATSDIIDMYFDDKKPARVVFRSSLQGSMIPMRQVNHNDMRLKNFQWLDDRRPKTKYDIFGD